jgi:hypothetical protein
VIIEYPLPGVSFIDQNGLMVRETIFADKNIWSSSGKKIN